MTQQSMYDVDQLNNGRSFSFYNNENYLNQQEISYITLDKTYKIPVDLNKCENSIENHPNLQIYAIKPEEQAIEHNSHFQYNGGNLYTNVAINVSISDSKKTDEVLENVETRKKQKRVRCEENWKRNRIKTKRNTGQSYVNWRNKEVAPRVLKPSCGDHCKLKCKVKISQVQRQQIFTNYWALGDVDRQRDFIACFVKFMKKKRQHKSVPAVAIADNVESSVESENLEANKSSRRKMTYIYNLPKDDRSVKVCKVFFLNTLSISHQVVKTVAAKYLKLGKNILLSDQRGKQNQEKYPESVKEAVRQHIMKFVVIANPPNTKGKIKIKPVDEINKPHVKIQKKKRVKQEENWKRNRIKTMRNSGQSYHNWRNNFVPERTLKPPCNDQCKLKCGQKFSQNQRIQIFTDYWALGDVNRQRFFIVQYVNFTKTKNQQHLMKKNLSQPSEASKECVESRRIFTYVYSLPMDDQVIRVCKVFFLNTLCISHQVVKTVAAKCASTGKCSIIADQRGKRKSDLQQNRKTINHKSGKGTTKDYIPSSMTVSKMFAIYKKECEERNVSVIATPYIYKKIFSQQLNARKFVIKKDQDCEVREIADAKKVSREDVKLEMKSTMDQNNVTSDKKMYLNNQYQSTAINTVKDNYLGSGDVYVDQSYIDYNVSRETDLHAQSDVNNHCKQELYWASQYIPY